LACDEQAAAPGVHGEMVEVADDALERDRLHQHQWSRLGSPGR
jgi:hypothetical protein